MWQSKEYFGCQLLSRCTQAANGIMELTTLTKSKIEIGDRIVAILADHKAAAGVKGNVGSGGDCRVESALPGLRIGHTCDEELIHFSTLEQDTVGYVNALFAVASDCAKLAADPAALFTKVNPASVPPLLFPLPLFGLRCSPSVHPLMFALCCSPRSTPSWNGSACTRSTDSFSRSGRRSRPRSPC